MPAKVYTDKDADLGVFANKTLAILGYGSQGHAHALNLKDSGCKVIIGLYPGSKSKEVAEQHGFEVVDTAEAVRRADVIMVGLPDMKQADVYENDILPEPDEGQDAALLARPLGALRADQAAQGHRLHHGRAERPGPHGPPPLRRRQRHAGADRGGAGQVEDGEEDGARLGEGHRFDARGRAPD